MDVQAIRADLLAEQDALDAVVAGLDDEAWARPTASPGWTVADQIGHLGFFDRTAALAITEPASFAASTAALLSAMTGDAPDADELTLADARAMPPAELLDWWRVGRKTLADATSSLADDDRVPWYGPSMGAKSFLTARLMECWAHGQDVCHTVGATLPASDRLRHIARIGFITRAWSYANRGQTAPADPVDVRLDGPGGETWEFGDEAAHCITGPAEDFCLVVTQRRHVDDTALTVTDGPAREWMLIAQAFAGPPTDGPPAHS